VTARYVPTQKPHAGEKAPEEFDRWEGEFYSRYSPEPYADLMRPGTALVIDDVEQADIGSIGSYNILDWKRRGCVGVVTDASARDTDEIAGEKSPLSAQAGGAFGPDGTRLNRSTGRSPSAECSSCRVTLWWPMGRGNHRSTCRARQVAAFAARLWKR